jgi:hypothetical protein
MTIPSRHNDGNRYNLTPDCYPLAAFLHRADQYGSYNFILQPHAVACNPPPQTGIRPDDAHRRDIEEKPGPMADLWTTPSIRPFLVGYSSPYVRNARRTYRCADIESLLRSFLPRRDIAQNGILRQMEKRRRKRQAAIDSQYRKQVREQLVSS